MGVGAFVIEWAIYGYKVKQEKKMKEIFKLKSTELLTRRWVVYRPQELRGNHFIKLSIWCL